MAISININRSPHYASPEIVNVSIKQVIIKRENDQQKGRKIREYRTMVQPPTFGHVVSFYMHY
jgi:hypothetical protein